MQAPQRIQGMVFSTGCGGMANMQLVVFISGTLLLATLKPIIGPPIISG